MADPTLRRWHDLMAAGGDSACQAAIEMIRSVGTGTIPKAMISRSSRARYGRTTPASPSATTNLGGLPR